MSLRICLLSPDATKTVSPGPEETLWEMAGYLANLGHFVHIVAPESKRTIDHQRIQIHSFRVPPYAYRWFVGHYWLTRRMMAVAKHLDVDIIHAAEYLSTAVSISIIPTVPSILTVPGNIFQRLAVPDGNQASYLYTELIKWAGRVSAAHCAGVIAFSREMMDWWERTGTSPDRLHLIPYGVDVNTFKPIGDARRQLGLADQALQLLYVGRLDREKGLFDLVEALRDAIADFGSREVQLHIVGSGALRAEIEAAVAEAGLQQQVFLHGPAARGMLPLWYSAADALILPSWIEPFGRVILEAFACGTPVIASSTGGPVDLVTEGVTGLLFPPRDVEKLKQVLKTVIDRSDLLPTMGEKALQRARGEFAWERIVGRIVSEVYEPILERSRAQANPRDSKNVSSVMEIR